MENSFTTALTAMQNRSAVAAITSFNAYTSRYGLTLSPLKAMELVETRSEALNRIGRVEFGTGVIEKLITAFCGSPYILQSNYAQMLSELLETFYYFKNETLDIMSDDELIAEMKYRFDNICQGSLELLQSRELENLAHHVRFGTDGYNEDSDEYGLKDDEDEDYNDE